MNTLAVSAVAATDAAAANSATPLAFRGHHSPMVVWSIVPISWKYGPNGDRGEYGCGSRRLRRAGAVRAHHQAAEVPQCAKQPAGCHVDLGSRRPYRYLEVR